MTQLKDVIQYYIGRPCFAERKGNGYITAVDEFGGVTIKMHGVAEAFYVWVSDIKPILRQLSAMRDDEILHCGRLLCAIPNNAPDFTSDIKRHHNTVGANYSSASYIRGQYFSIYNEKNKADSVGHIEVGWYSDKIDKRKTRELWKIGGCHQLTLYLLKQGFGLWGLIESGQAIDQKTLTSNP